VDRLLYEKNLMEIVKLQERERIVNLLQSNDAWWLIDTESSIEKQNTVNSLINLIKGDG
jgi:hypothetical protein